MVSSTFSEPPRAVIFDLDGTLTRPLLDFDRMREEIGLPRGVDILAQIAAGGEPLRLRAEAILRGHELDAIERAELSDGCRALLDALAARQIPCGILTRNLREVVERFGLRFDLRFAAVFTREDGPPKPSPAGVFSLCERLGVAPPETLAVGDYKFDVLAGRCAGCRTALVTKRSAAEIAAWGPPQEWGPPDLLVPDLHALLGLWHAGCP